ncbi:hypothetical protein NDU88_005773 [Pleurodeles waltl]|uniref:Uncharacterized protein n=1 Tax=Pleurodeles waltl TaxID=8319 RepID=A0AAV7X1P4_PLEWA|nr:hypothetical protein NDU88_005773 [Pleurodeles waltl]
MDSRPLVHHASTAVGGGAIGLQRIVSKEHVSDLLRKARHECSPCRSLFGAPFPPPVSCPVPLVPHPVPGEATLLLKRGGSFVRLPWVSGRLPGFLAVPIPSAFRSSTKRRLCWSSRRLFPPRTPVPPSSCSRRSPLEGK